MASDLLVPATVLITVGSTEAAEIAVGKGPTMKPIIAGFLLGIGLYALYGLDDYLGHMFALLVITTAVLTNGLAISKGLSGKQKGSVTL